MMKTKGLLFTLTAGLSFSLSAQTSHTVTFGSFSYVPQELIISAGDTVNFPATNFHPFAEVEKSTWDANGSALKTGGLACTTNCSKVYPSAGEYYYVCTAHAQGSMKGKVIVQEALGGVAYNASESNGLKVFPNPANSAVTIELTETAELSHISLLSSVGTEVKAIQAANGRKTYILDISHVEPGMYHLVVNTDSKKISRKIIIR